MRIHFFYKGSAKQGFTLVELLVVLAIIGLLAVLAVIALNNARQKARNTKRNADIRQYVTAFELYYDSSSSYPYIGSPNAIRCLGDYDDNNCWQSGNRSESSAINNALAIYISQLPAGDLACLWEGYVYGHNTGLNPVLRYIEWFLEGTSRSCGVGQMQSANYQSSGCTLCRYTFLE